MGPQGGEGKAASQVCPVYRQRCRWCLGSSEAAPNLGHLYMSRQLSQGAFLLPATGGAVGPRSPWASG